MRATVTVRLKAGVLDPAGEAVRRALISMGHGEVRDVRISKLVELEIDGGDAALVKHSVERMADELLANPVMERFVVEVTPR